MKRQHKYRAKPFYICPDCGNSSDWKLCRRCGCSDGEHWASQREYGRWNELKQAQMGGLISGLRRQVPYPFSVAGRPVVLRAPRYPNGRQIKYVADFVYVENGETVVEDNKGHWTKDAKLKVAFFEAQYGIRVRITGAAAKRAA